MTANTKSSPLEQSVKYDYSDLIGKSMEKRWNKEKQMHNSTNKNGGMLIQPNSHQNRT